MTGASAGALAPFVPRPDREGRDRLEILTALINGPSFDPMFRPDVIDIPPDHPIYRWTCVVDRCERPHTGSADLCSEHQQQWSRERSRGVGKAAFLLSAKGLRRHVRVEDMPCRICPGRPVTYSDLLLCHAHHLRWYRRQQAVGEAADFAEWCTRQAPLAGYGPCDVTVCLSLANSPLGLCARHESRYDRDGRPGGAVLPDRWWHRFEQQGRSVPVVHTDELSFRRWCAAAPATPFCGQLNLLGLRPLVAAELKWGLFISTRRARPQRRDLGWIRSVVTACRDGELDSLVGFEPDETCRQMAAMIIRQIQAELRLVYFTPADTREAGFLETDHFGVRFPHRGSYVELTGIPQRWLRDLVWDHLAELLQSPHCPRSGGTIDALRRAAVELGVFLELDAPGGGHDPRLLAPSTCCASSPTSVTANARRCRRWR